MPTLTDLIRPLLLPASIITPTKLRRGLSAPITSTKFGGHPYAELDEDWPICGGCEEGLSFIFQCNLAECPHQKAQGLFAFYYCHECSSWGDIPPEIEDAWLVRRYEAPAANKAVELEDASPDNARTKECSVKLEIVQSLPNWESINDLLPAAAELSAKSNKEEPWAAYQKTVEELLGGEPEINSQIGGYPNWIQGAESIECEKCKTRMRLLGQIDSEEDAGLMWGDVGAVYLFECPKHADQIQMRLQCF